LLTSNFAAWVLAEISSEAPSINKTSMKRAEWPKRAASGNARNDMKISSQLYRVGIPNPVRPDPQAYSESL
jgi:hypothetical protein